jgi:hypothetical protein
MPVAELDVQRLIVVDLLCFQHPDLLHMVGHFTTDPHIQFTERVHHLCV